MICCGILMICYGICMICYEKLNEGLNNMVWYHMLYYAMIWYAKRFEQKASVYRRVPNLSKKNEKKSLFTSYLQYEH